MIGFKVRSNHLNIFLSISTKLPFLIWRWPQVRGDIWSSMSFVSHRCLFQRPTAGPNVPASSYCKVGLKMHLPYDAFFLPLWSLQIFKSQHFYLQQPLHSFSGSRALIYAAHYHIVQRNHPFNRPNKVNKMAFTSWHRSQTILIEKSQVSI